MSFSHTITRRVDTSGSSIQSVKTLTADGRQSVSVAVNDSETDKFIEFDLTVANLQSIFILASQDMTLETNDGGTPTDTISLLAGQAYVWHAGSYFVNLITANITALYATNASGTDGTLDIEMIYDATP